MTSGDAERIDFCTLCDQGYLVRTLALRASLVRHAQPFRLHTLCLDQTAFDILSRLALPDLVPIRRQDLEAEDPELVAAQGNRSALEYCFTCKPCVPLYVLRHRPDAKVVALADSDLWFFASPAPLVEEMRGSSVLLHLHRFPEEHTWRTEQFGLYNAGLSLFRNDAQGRASLEWWRARCIEWCHDRTEPGLYTDQKYLDQMASMPGVRASDHPGAGLAPWNVAHTPLARGRQGVLVQGEPLIFYHFHGIRVVTRSLYVLGIRRFGVRMTRTLKNKVYAPYLRELKALLGRYPELLDSSQRQIRWPERREFVQQALDRRMMALVGPLAFRFSVRHMFRWLPFTREWAARLLR